MYLRFRGPGWFVAAAALAAVLLGGFRHVPHQDGRVTTRVNGAEAVEGEVLVKYRDRPMSYADACIVRMTEIHAKHAVFTLDNDFSIYRRHGREPLDLIAPDPEGAG